MFIIDIQYPMRSKTVIFNLGLPPTIGLTIIHISTHCTSQGLTFNECMWCE